MKRSALLVLLILFSVGLVWGQTLAVGDIAIIGISTDSPDSYSFVALTTIPSGTEINFTDNGVLSSGAIRGGEGTEAWTATSEVAAGTVIELTGLSGLSGSGDQVIAYQGTEASPTFIFAAQVNSNVWQIGSNDSNQSDLPPGLINGTTAVAAGSGSGSEDEFDNAWYSGAITSGTKEQLLAAIADNSNWSGDNASYSPITTNFTVSLASGNQSPVISNITALPANPTSSEAVTVSATVTDDNSVNGVDLHWGLTNSFGTTISMSNGGSGDIYSAVITAQADGETVYFEIEATDDESVVTTSTEQSYVVTDPTPTITLSETELTGFEYIEGYGASAEQSFTVLGTNLAVDAVISIAAPTNYEISTDPGDNFDTFAANPIPLTPTDITIPKTIYVRLKAGLAEGDYNGEVITVTATDADSKTVTCSGSVNAFVDLAAAFSASPNPVYEGFPVTFTDDTVGGIAPYTYAWDFDGDDTEDSVLQNPEFTYLTNGTYIAKLTITDSAIPQNVHSATTSIVVSVIPEAPAVFFSEYIEGSSNNKAIEIYNASGSDLSMAGFKVGLYSNGSGTIGNDFIFTNQILNAGDVFVISNTQATGVITAASDVTSDVTFFGGDDALALLFNDVIIDVIGTIGSDPGTAWSVAGVPNATAEHTLVRKSIVTEGNTNWASSAGTTTEDSEWIVLDQDTFDNLGSHSMDLTPVTLTTFTAIQFQNDMATIMWETASESNMSHFKIYRGELEISSVTASNTSETHSYSVQDQDLEAGQTYNYYLEAVEYDGSSDTYGPIVLSVMEEVDPQEPPSANIESTILKGNFPNPFNPTTMIKFNVANDETGTLEIYSAKGQLVDSVDFGTGEHTFTWNANNHASGIYFYKLKSQSYSETKKMILLK